MKGYILGRDVSNNYYCITIKTDILTPLKTPIINHKFALYNTPTSIIIQKISLLGSNESEVDGIEVYLEDVVDLYFFKKGNIITDTNIDIYKSKQRLLYRVEFLRLQNNQDTFTGVIKFFLYDGDLTIKVELQNGIHIKFYSFYHNYIVKHYNTKNSSVVINLQSNSKKKYKGFVTFTGPIFEHRIVTFPSYFYTIYDEPSQLNMISRLRRKINIFKSYRDYSVEEGFKNIFIKSKKKNNRKHGLQWDTLLVNSSSSIYQNNRLISNKIVDLFQLAEVKYVNTRQTLKIM
jgi:hypothetical protein